MFNSKLRADQHRISQDLQRQLEHVQKSAEANADRASRDHQRQLEHVQKTAEANADRTRKRMEAEVADLQSSLRRLEADLLKVGASLQ